MAQAAAADIELLLRQSVECYSQARGLAVVVANETSSETRVAPERLLGAGRDLARMREVFSKLKFVTICMLNATAKEIKDVVKAVAKFGSYPESYRRIAFTFSGHGDESCIHTRSERVSLEDIVTPLQPMHAPHLASIPKLFFIDACRGNQHDLGVMSRGATEQRRPSYGNTLVAHSTLVHCKAFEISKSGGVWMKEVGEKLCTVRKSVLDVLTEVNAQLMESYKHPNYEHVIQQPVVHSTLHEEVRLLEEAESDRNPLGTMAPQYRSPGVSPSAMLSPTNVPKQPVIAAVFSAGSTSNSRPPRPQQVLTPQWGPIQPQRVPQSPPQLPATCTGVTNPTHTALNEEKDEPVFSGLQHSDGSHKRGRYKALLNHYSQTGIIQSQSSYSDSEEYDTACKRMCYRSNLEVTLASNAVVRGGSQIHPSKQLSREEAAKDIVQQMVARGVVTLQQTSSEDATSSTPPGSSSQLLDISSRGTVSVPKIYKQRLKEHYDKIGCAGAPITYRTQEASANGGFVSEVTVKAGGELLQAQGDMCKNKKEAEHSAACRALQKLSLN